MNLLAERGWKSFIPTHYINNTKENYEKGVWEIINNYGHDWLTDTWWVDTYVYDIFPVGEFIMVVFKADTDAYRYEMTLYKGTLE